MKKNWYIVVTRETVLIERYLRVEGYRKMFGDLSKIKVENLLIINKNGLTSQYGEVEERDKNIEIIFTEYKNDILKKFMPYWTGVLKNLATISKKFLQNPTKEHFQNFIEFYEIGRAIVFYTNYLAKLYEQKNMKENIETIGHWHEKAEVETSKAWDIIKYKIKEIGEEHNIPIEELVYYLPDEFMKFLETHEKIDSPVLKERRYYYVLYLNNGKIEFYIGEKAQQIENEQIEQEKITETNELKGVVACKGYAKGRVRIVNTEEQMKKMQPGEILISTMTTPRLMPAVTKAAAIVTDEGGITSHAAIVSREMKKPCVIGTKNATRVFKDGDMVEVDADKGVVRKV